MKAIVCVDKEMGIAFLNRRLSRDRVLTKDILEDLENTKLYVHPKTQKVFEEFEGAPLIITENPLKECQGVCFLELESPKSELYRIDTLVLYHWNRDYPSDVKLGFSPKDEGFKLTDKKNFAGYSHEKITKETWVKK